ncbi:MotE family protein [Albidovulum sp.]
MSKAVSPPPAMRRRRPARSRPGTLFWLAALFAASGAIRIGLQASHAFAVEAQPVAAAPEAQSCAPPPDVMAMLTELREREARVAEREVRAGSREQALALAQADIERRLAELTRAEEELAQTLAQADGAADRDVQTLVAVYEQMKPKDAAALFDEMDPAFAAGFLARMRADAAAQVMAGLEPKKAYAISVLLAGRNANAPQN